MNHATLQQLIGGFPQQLTVGLAVSENAGARSRKPPNSIVIAGMGGSALPGLLLQQLLLQGQWRIASPIRVHRNYDLPDSASRDTLIVCISHSGNTEETVSAYKRARAKGCPVMVITTGGTVAQLAKRNNIPLVTFPADTPPRFAVGYQFGALVGLLVSAGVLPKAARRDLERTTKALKPLGLFAKAQRIVTQLKYRIPVIYASERNAAVAYIFKIQFNENAKIPAFLHLFPELNHNEMNSYARLSPEQSTLSRRLAVILLDDPKDDTRIKKRIAVTAGIIRKANVTLVRFPVPGKSALERSLNGIIVAEWLSTSLAQLYGIDPIPTDLIEAFKKKLKQ